MERKGMGWKRDWNVSENKGKEGGQEKGIGSNP